MIITAALVLVWMNRIEPSPAPYKRAVAQAIADAANADKDPVDAAAQLTAIGYYESGFYPDAISSSEDPTWSYGPWQLADVWLPPLPVSLDWQARRALELVRESQARCGDLTRYVSGHCQGAPSVAATRASLADRFVLADFPGVYVEPPGVYVVTIHNDDEVPAR